MRGVIELVGVAAAMLGALLVWGWPAVLLVAGWWLVTAVDQ